MVFRTEINVPPADNKSSLPSKVLTAGSCFADVMGQQMQYYKVNTLVNPFGTIYNPLSLFRLLQAALNPDDPFTGPLVQRDNLWFAYDLHSSFAETSQEKLLINIQNKLKQVHSFLQQTDMLVLTLGTAVGYVHKETNQLVANCHKIPQQHFCKKILSITEITGAFSALYTVLLKLSPRLQILLTVSPVRHLKETLEINSVSKSVLRVSCHEITQQFRQVSYFPAYELMLDDLRDYRFYKADMIHPTEVAEDYIWQKFKQAYFDEAFQKFTSEWDKINQALAHRPFHPESEAHQAFLHNTLRKLEQLQTAIDCTTEIAQVKNQLKISQA